MKQFQPVGSYMRVSIVFGSIDLVVIAMNEAISACRFLYAGFYCIWSNCSGFLVTVITNEAISACRFLKVEGSYKRVFYSNIF